MIKMYTIIKISYMKGRLTISKTNRYKLSSNYFKKKGDIF